MTALQWIVKEAKAQKNKYPTKFKTWKEYIKQASKQYNTGIKPSFPKKNKVGVVKKKAVPKKKIGNMKVAKYKVGQKVYSYQNKDYSAPINKLVYSPWNNSGKYDKRDTYKYVLSLKDGNSNYIDEKSISKKSIGAVKKKAAPKKKAAKKKIGYSKIRLKQEKGITKVLKNTPRTLFPYTAEEKIVKAGKKYFDEQAKKISGFNKSLYNDIDSINNRIYKLKGIILDEKWSIKNAKKIGYSTEQINMAKHFIAQNTKAIKELQIHLKELKKII